ncbi:hypothetical protein F5879DRAFT_694671 [Lentinula edodes]|nr:hypothetical protein F5879DRAFT_694671 [Lentinula edodes]
MRCSPLNCLVELLLASLICIPNNHPIRRCMLTCKSIRCGTNHDTSIFHHAVSLYLPLQYQSSFVSRYIFSIIPHPIPSAFIFHICAFPPLPQAFHVLRHDRTMNGYIFLSSNLDWYWYTHI